MFHVKHSNRSHHRNVQHHEVSGEILAETREHQQSLGGKITQYVDELLSWNQKINLVSRTVSRETVMEHITHSLLAKRLGLLSGIDLWLDTGTGGGLPGLPLSLAEPEKNWILNDNIQKKMRAVESIIQRMQLENVTVRPGSISLQVLEPDMGIVSKHAFKADDLLKKLGKNPWKRVIMWKGMEDAVQEIERVSGAYAFNLYHFRFGESEPFYEGKGLLSIERL